MQAFTSSGISAGKTCVAPGHKRCRQAALIVFQIRAIGGRPTWILRNPAATVAGVAGALLARMLGNSRPVAATVDFDDGA
jgi:hypothetical protein